ncbi:MAG: hypothetical protein AAGG45_10470 [Pseudomonadota bacterium]
MTRDEIIEFYDSISSFAVPNREEIERVNALSPKDRGALLDYVIEVARASGTSDKSPEQIKRESREKAFARFAAE